MLPDFKGDSVPICKFKHKVNTYSAFLYVVEHVACKGLISIEDSHIFKYTLNTETRLKFKESLQKKSHVVWLPVFLILQNDGGEWSVSCLCEQSF